MSPVGVSLAPLSAEPHPKRRETVKIQSVKSVSVHITEGTEDETVSRTHGQLSNYLIKDETLVPCLGCCSTAAQYNTFKSSFSA